MKILNLLGLSLVVALLVGCAGCSTAPAGIDVAPRVERIAAIATPLILASNPEMRAGFVAAQIALEELSKDEYVTLEDVLAIVHRLPVEKLESPEAALLIEGGFILIDPLFGGKAIDLTKLGSTQKIAKALAAGIKRGLG